MTAGDAGKSVALVEAKVTAVSDMLTEIREATKENVERKQVRCGGAAQRAIHRLPVFFDA